MKQTVKRDFSCSAADWLCSFSQQNSSVCPCWDTWYVLSEVPECRHSPEASLQGQGECHSDCSVIPGEASGESATARLL